MAESNPGLWIPEEDTLATVYMTISRAMMMIRVMITGFFFLRLLSVVKSDFGILSFFFIRMRFEFLFVCTKRP